MYGVHISSHCGKTLQAQTEELWLRLHIAQSTTTSSVFLASTTAIQRTCLFSRSYKGLFLLSSMQCNMLALACLASGVPPSGVDSCALLLYSISAACTTAGLLRACYNAKWLLFELACLAE